MNSSDQILWIAYPFLGVAFVACAVLWKKTIWAKRSALILLIELFVFGAVYQISNGEFGINFNHPFFFRKLTDRYEWIIGFGWNNLSLFILSFVIISFCWHLLENGDLFSSKAKSKR